MVVSEAGDGTVLREREREVHRTVSRREEDTAPTELCDLHKAADVSELPFPAREVHAQT